NQFYRAFKALSQLRRESQNSPPPSSLDPDPLDSEAPSEPKTAPETSEGVPTPTTIQAPLPNAPTHFMWRNDRKTNPSRMLPNRIILTSDLLLGWVGRLVIDRTISDEWPLIPETRLTAKEVAALFNPAQESSKSTIAQHFGPPVTVEYVEACICCVNAIGPKGLKSWEAT
ncbi:MAG: hypothetical protein ABI353_06990, partial [Isosphaeraceae bacterium]